MAAAHSLSSSLRTLFVGICLLFSTAAHLSFHVADAAGFSMELIHRDDPKSPLYDSASTPFSRLHDSIYRSISRGNSLNSHNSNFLLHNPPDGISSHVTHNFGSNFIMILKIGSHKNRIHAIMDTASSFNWLLCHPCENCYKHPPNIFVPGMSTSYNKLNCSDHRCYGKKCDGEYMCEFSLRYNSEDSFIRGILSTDTLRLHPTLGNEIVDLENIIFGCIHETEGDKFYRKSMGIISLSRDPFSFLSQLGERSYGRRFSYCLPFVEKKSGRLNFGSAANIPGDGAVTTPLIIDDTSSYLYILRLLTITVAKAGEQPINVTPLHDVEAANQLSYNIVMDSGNQYTYIPSEMMLDLSEKVKEHTPYPPKERYNSMKELLDTEFDLCFDIRKAKGELKLPIITFHFARCAKLFYCRHIPSR